MQELFSALPEREQKVAAVIGLGYVGLPLALLAARKGYRVIGIDVDPDKVEAVRQQRAPFIDDNVRRDLKKFAIEADTDFQKISEASVIVVCVPTPVHENYLPNLKPLESACTNISNYLQRGQLVIIESTVNPEVCENIALPLLELASGLKGGQDFFLAHCPERINTGDSQWPLEKIPRVVGSLEPVGLAKALAFYRSLIEAEIKPMGSLKEAEAVKIVENSFRDINIAFVNELAMSFSRLGIDIENVIAGAATKPFAFLPHYPGCGVGGHCIPVDPYYLIEHAKQNGFYHNFLVLARQINNRMPAYTAKLVTDALRERQIDPQGAKVAVLGLSYKPDIDDCRESPALHIVEYLKEAGMNVAAYDPFVPQKSTTTSLKMAIANAPAVVIATAHRLFRWLEPAYFLQNGVSIVVDGRNCLNKQKFAASGLIYRGIGR